jgi:transposase
MPYACESKKLPKSADRRIKLSDDDKEQIKELHRGGNSIHSLSKKFGVSRRTVQFILYPERKERNLKLRDERGGSAVYYDKELHREYMKTHRRYKHNYFKAKDNG